MFITCLLHVPYNVPIMFPTYSLHVPFIFCTCLLHIQYMFPTYSLYIYFPFTTCSLHILYIIIHFTFATGALHVHYMSTKCIHIQIIVSLRKYNLEFLNYLDDHVVRAVHRLYNYGFNMQHIGLLFFICITYILPILTLLTCIYILYMTIHQS
jgi:hypothetical protein